MSHQSYHLPRYINPITGHAISTTSAVCMFLCSTIIRLPFVQLCSCPYRDKINVQLQIKFQILIQIIKLVIRSIYVCAPLQQPFLTGTPHESPWWWQQDHNESAQHCCLSKHTVEPVQSPQYSKGQCQPSWSALCWLKGCHQHSTSCTIPGHTSPL